MNAELADMKQHESCASLSELLGDRVHCQWAVIFWKESFSLSCRPQPVCLNLGCKEMCCHPSFVVLSLEHSRLTTMLKGPRIFWMVSEHWCQLKVTDYISPQQRNPPALGSFEAGHWLLSGSENPRRHLRPIEGCCFIYTGNLLFRGTTFINYPS